MAAIGVENDGKKTVLGLREGATENATVVRELLEDMAREDWILAPAALCPGRR